MTNYFNSTFKVKPTKPLKRSGFKRKSGTPYRMKPRKGLLDAVKPLRTRVNLEPWVRAIPESTAHGSGTLQKRLWRLTSDYVRIRDWYKFGGRCIATGVYIPHWNQGQAGHLKPWTKCNGIFKYDVQNIHMQSYISNKYGNSDTWYNYEQELKKRWGTVRSDIENWNRVTNIKSLGVDTLKDKMKMLLIAFANLPEQPDYYQRVKSLLELTVE